MLSTDRVRYSLLLPLNLVYVHTGNLQDYPIRILVTGSSHFDASGMGVDLYLEGPNTTAASAITVIDDKGSSSYSVIPITIKLKFHMSPGKRLSYGASICFNICCSMKNDYGRRCWRDGGACYISLLEIMAASSLNPDLYTFRRVYISGFNVQRGDRTTGLLGVALGSEYNSPSTINHEGWTVHAKIRDTNVILYSQGSGNGESNNNTSISKEEMICQIFQCDSLLESTASLPQQYQFKSTLQDLFSVVKGSTTSSSPTSIAEETKHHRREICEGCAEYERVLENQGRLVVILEPNTKNMRCPYAPTDTCVSELLEQYETRLLTRVDSNVGGVVGSKMCGGTTSAATHHSWKVNGNHLRRHSIPLKKKKTAVATIGPKMTSGLAYSQLVKTMADPNMEEHITYLPFFTFVLFQPLVVYKKYWETALRILAEREQGDLLSYTQLFLSSAMTPSRRAADAFQLLCDYSQALEYISDYYLPKPCHVSSEPEGSGRFSSFFKFGGGDTTGTVERKEIEQFWNCLISMCGDCDDLTMGHAQFYDVFVVRSWKQPKVNATINSNPVLKEMRRILACNYVLMANIDAVYLPKQSVGDEVDDDSTYTATSSSSPPPHHDYYHHPYLGVSPDIAAGVYARDTQNMNSAHAAVVLIPKLYFERCVNRSRIRGESPVFPPFTSSTCCFYHSYPPDIYNDDLPVLFGEGTSMLRCSDEIKDPCSEKWFKSTLFGDPYVNDVMKGIIYADKGKSAFYKASLFGACTAFLENHGVATFTFARMNPTYATNSRVSPFLRGVSHHQLSFKSEVAILVPYGYLLGPPSTTENANYEACQGVKFMYREVSPFMARLCISEAKRRCRAKKIADPDIHSSTGGSNTIYYNMMDHDTVHSILKSKTLLQSWASRMNGQYGGKVVGSVSPSSNRFHLFVDNFYVDERLIGILEGLVERATRKKNIPFNISIALEKRSQDIQIWRATFTFPPRYHQR